VAQGVDPEFKPQYCKKKKKLNLYRGLKEKTRKKDFWWGSLKGDPGIPKGWT
jgi:hypothetical protein